jgi:hypothetical protein
LTQLLLRGESIPWLVITFDNRISELLDDPFKKTPVSDGQETAATFLFRLKTGLLIVSSLSFHPGSTSPH